MISPSESNAGALKVTCCVVVTFPYKLTRHAKCNFLILNTFLFPYLDYHCDFATLQLALCPFPALT